jgi:hypothetical protein
VSRTGWLITGLLAAAFLLLPGFLERWRRVRRAVGAVFLFWISLNLWGTSLHLAGLRPTGESRGAMLLGPPLLLTAAWIFWDLRRRPQA